jgi:hypothetical protein
MTTLRAWRLGTTVPEEEMKVIQSGPDKVHFAVIFVRYGTNGKEIGKFPSLYMVTLKDGHWGVQGRSSYAP